MATAMLVSSCSATHATPTVMPASAGAATAFAPAKEQDGAADPSPDTGWSVLAPGLDERSWHDPDGTGRGLYALRVEPEGFDIGVAYSPGSPKFLSEWLAITDATAVVNAGYFDEQDRATALVVADGKPSGQSYTGFGGMLAVRGGSPSLTWLATEPFAGAEGMSAAIQSAPMLVSAGQVVYDGVDVERNRRAAVALDGSGRLLLFVTPGVGFSLAALAERLMDPELDVRDALNLDGGKSGGVAIQPPGAGIPALVPVPAVITVHRRAQP